MALRSDRAYVIFEVSSKRLLARIGLRKTHWRIMVLWSVCSALFATLSIENSDYFTRFL